MEKDAISITFGPDGSFVSSGGIRIYYSKELQAAGDALDQAKRIVGKKTKGSANAKKAEQEVEKCQKAFDTELSAFAQNAVNEFTTNVSCIYMEKLSEKKLSAIVLAQKEKWQKKYFDELVSEFSSLLASSCDSNGIKLIGVPSDDNSLTVCSSCGYVEKNKITKKNWTCPLCNTRHDLAVNYAKLLLKEGRQYVR